MLRRVAENPDITRLLDAASGGNRQALDKLMSLVYGELRALAQEHLAKEPTGLTLQATALAHEAYLRLLHQKKPLWQSRNQFFALAAIAIRRILVDHARAKHRLKRGGGADRVPLDGVEAEPVAESIDLEALDEALNQLASLHARQALIVELRFFGGLTMDQIAEHVGVSLAAVEKDWTAARAWLRSRLHTEHGP